MKYTYAILAAVAIALGLSCTGPAWVNFTAPLQGTLGVAFVNETPYTVSTFWGTYNPLDLQHGVTVTPITLAGGAQSSSVATVATTRDLDVAGSALANAAKVGRVDNVTPSDITDTISFKDDNGTVVGTAPAAMFTLGNDYASGDFVEIHFKQVVGTTQFVVVMNATPGQ